MMTPEQREGYEQRLLRERPKYQALKYRSVTDIVRPIREIVRHTEETTGHSVRPK
jgi:hypothetical protein